MMNPRIQFLVITKMPKLIINFTGLPFIFYDIFSFIGENSLKRHKESNFYKGVLSHKALLFKAGVLLGLNVLVTTLFPWPIKIFIDYVYPSKPSGLLIVDKWVQTPIAATVFLSLTLLGLYMIGLVLEYFSTLMTKKLSSKVGETLRNNLFNRLLESRYSMLTTKRTNEIGAYFWHDISNLEEYVFAATTAIVKSLPTLVFIVVVMQFVSPLLSVLLIAGFPLSILVSSKLSKNLRKRQKVSRSKLTKMTEFLGSTFKEIRLIKSFGFEDKISSSSRIQFTNYSFAILETEENAVKYNLSITGVQKIIKFFVFASGGLAVVIGDLPLGSLILFLSYLDSTRSPINNISKLLSRREKTKVSLQAYEEIMSLSQHQRENFVSDQGDEFPSTGQLKLVNLSFKNGHRDILEKLNLEINSGEIVALKGDSGSGKSTVIDLLNLFSYDYEGEILWNNTEIRDLNVKIWRKNLSTSYQLDSFIDSSLKENIDSNNRYRRNELIKSLSKVNGNEILSQRFENNLEYQMGANYQFLSGGEAKRLNLLRTMNKPAQIFIFDEPSSHLDESSKEKLKKSMEQLKREGKIVLLVSHNDNELSWADRIICIKEAQSGQSLPYQ